VSVSSLLSRVALGVAVAQAAAPPAPAPPQTSIVMVTYADGRRTSLQIGATGCTSWTYLFPRVEPWTPPPNQLPLSAIKYVCERASDGVRVAVSVLRGSPSQKEDPIAMVLVRPSQPVIVEELRAVGAQPVTLSLGYVTGAILEPPRVEVVTALIEVLEVSVSTGPVSMNHVLLRNRSTKAVRGIDIQTTRQGRLATSGRRVGRDGSALIDAGQDFVLDMRVPAGRPSPDGSVTLAAPDRIHISAVTWSDGSFEGAFGGINILVSDLGDRHGLTRVVAELQRARSQGVTATPGALRTAIEAVPIDVPDSMIADTRERIPAVRSFANERVASLLRVSMQAMKNAVLSDLAGFESAPRGAGSFEAWLNTTTERYLRWLERLK
jgi:hypothetical protein